MQSNGSQQADIAVIILQKNEALHIRRCLEKLAPLAPRQVFVVDCHSTDGSDRVAAEMGATVVYHEWPGLYAKQLNWALDNLPIRATWILRLDADEYLYPETCAEVKRLVTSGGLPPDVTSLSLSLSRAFSLDARFASGARRTFRWSAFSGEALVDARIVRWMNTLLRAKGETIGSKVNSQTTILIQWTGGVRSIEVMRDGRLRMRWHFDGENFTSSLRKKPITGCRATCGRLSTFSSAMFSRAVSLTDVRVGCGTFGRGCGTAVLSIMRLGGCSELAA